MQSKAVAHRGTAPQQIAGNLISHPLGMAGRYFEAGTATGKEFPNRSKSLNDQTTSF
jgi:hypothetical protein